MEAEECSAPAGAAQGGAAGGAGGGAAGAQGGGGGGGAAGVGAGGAGGWCMEVLNAALLSLKWGAWQGGCQWHGVYTGKG